MWKNLWEAIADLFVNVLFVPFDALKTLELENWWAANIVSWVLTIIGLVAFVYWMLQLRKFTKEEDKSITAHSYL